MANVTIDERDFSGPLALNGFRWQTERLSWKAVGGCDRARLKVTSESGTAGLWGLADLLRCPLKVTGQEGSPAWWGYVSAVEIHVQGRIARVDLAQMANRAAVSYAENTPEYWTALRTKTGFIADAASVALFGAKEKIYAGGQMSQEQAYGYRAARLAKYGKPVMRLSNEVKKGQRALTAAYAIVEGRGWWETLNWRYYSDTRGREGNLNSGLSFVWGDATARTKMAQGITPAENWRTKEIWMKLAGSAPGDNLTLSLCARDPVTSVPSTVLASATMLGNYLSQSLEWTRFELPAEVALTGGELYWLVLSRSGAVHAINNYRVGLEERDLYLPGYVLESSGIGWAIRAPVADLSFMVVGREETTVQLARMLASTAGGQFLAGVRNPISSGLYWPTYHDGHTLAGDEIENVMASGTSAGKRLLATVDVRRILKVYEQPAASAAKVLIGRDGQLRGLDGEPLQLAEQPAGQWARLLGLSPIGARVAVQETTWIEAVSWNGKEFVIEES